ncbi:uncharacterized protein [Dysidea avara]|uniref:uncharacterized protein isoform X2 n=1 Tax=Dysidea avara TaxID=196820 RepID=UPI003328B541
MDDEEDTKMDYHPYTGTSHPLSHQATPHSMYGPEVIDVIKRKPEFSFLIRYYDLLYQSLMPNCKLTIKILKQHLEISSDVERFIVDGESPRIRCQRILNFLVVQLDATRDYKSFCCLFKMISVMPDLPDKLRTAYSSRLITTTKIDNDAIDSDIIQCVDKGPLDDKADQVNVIGRRRCKLVNTTTTTTTTTKSSTVEERDLPRKLQNKDFTELKAHYHTILQLMPDSYEQSVGKLQDYISDDQICMILSSSDSITANKIILDCLIERMSCREEVLDLCNQLETITTSHQLMMVISEIRFGASSQLYQATFTRIRLHPSSKVLLLLKKNYTRLCHCLPKDYKITIDKLKQFMHGSFSDYMAELKILPSNELINEAIVGDLISNVTKDQGMSVFCDIMKMLCHDDSSRNFIDTLRNDHLVDLSLPPPTTTATNIPQPSDSMSSSSGSHHRTALHQTSGDSSVRVGSTPVVTTPIISQPSQGSASSRIAFQERLHYNLTKLEKGIQCPPPPPLPPDYVRREYLMNEIVSKLCQSTIDPDSYGTCLTVTGAGGFGKTSIVIALCYHPVIKEQFTDGVVLIELGPQATDPSVKLSQLYHLLTGEYLKQGDINHAEQEIKQLTSLYCRNLLVIIDDVWHVDDAEPIVKAFSNCKIVLTTRMNCIEQYIPTKQVVSVGPMEQSEAITLLTCKVIDTRQLSQDDVSLLDELIQDVHLWPLLLSLVRRQLSHSLKRLNVCYYEAIQNVKAKLHDKGLKAFDKNDIARSRKHAVKSCIEATLELLTKSLSNKIKSLILWTGIGTSLQTAVLHNLWTISEHEAGDDVDLLWDYGLVQFTQIKLPSQNSTQRCVEVHAVISHYIIECMGSNEVIELSPNGELATRDSVAKGMIEQFRKCFGVLDKSSLRRHDSNYFKYKILEIENFMLPNYLKTISMWTVQDPHYIMAALQSIQRALMVLPNIATSLPSLNDEINSLISDCRTILKDVYKMSRTLNQNIQRCMYQRDYPKLIQTIEAYNSKYPTGTIAQKAVTMVKKILPHCDSKHLDNLFLLGHLFLFKTSDYHDNTLQTLPAIKFYTKELQLIYSLQAESPDSVVTNQYWSSGQRIEDLKLMKINHFIKIREAKFNINHAML